MKQNTKSGLRLWKPGQSGNPAGRPQGARAKFSEQACADALADWTANGAATLARVRATDPSTYLRVLFSIIPKDIAVSIEQRTGPMDSEEGRYLRRLVDIVRTVAGDGDPMIVLDGIEQDLRARYATPIDDNGSKAVAITALVEEKSDSDQSDNDDR
jgi:Family of unknown function (DUF5681)